MPGYDILQCAAAVLLQAGRPTSTGKLTLDLLRSNLSHETSAKMARLAALAAEWNQGRYRPEDPADIREIVFDLRAIFLRHARLAVVAPSDFLRLVRVLVSLRTILRLVRPALRQNVLSTSALRKVDREILRLRLGTRRFVDSMSARYGRRIARIVTEAMSEVRREIGGGLAPGTVKLVMEDPDGSAGGWVPRSEEPYWSDLFRNLMRNAVEATHELTRRTSGGPLPVVVRLMAMASEVGTTVEIRDHGIGMTPTEVDQIWLSGRGRHGPGRGRGLTESKLAFVMSRGNITVSSIPGEGTRFRVDLPFRDVAVPNVGCWRLAPVYAPIAAVILVAVMLILGLPDRSVVHGIRISSPTALQAISREGRVLWARELHETLLRNDGGGDLTRSDELNMMATPLILRDTSGDPAAFIVATKADDGPGHVWSIRADNSRAERHTLNWCSPHGEHLGQLRSPWQDSMPWPGREDPVVIVHVRDGNYSDSATQFFTADLESLGTYYHHGHLTFRCAGDLDDDGRIEVLLVGINNSAAGDTTIFPFKQTVYIDCLVLLEAPAVSGQSYPATNWPGMAMAQEEGYLLLPPLTKTMRPTIRRVEIASRTRDDGVRFEVILQDGRIYRLNSRLRPISCVSGDATDARRLSPIRPVGPLAYWGEGGRELIELPVR